MKRTNHTSDFHKKGRRIYQRLKARLEPKYKGQIIAIEVESGQYVLGKDELQVALEAIQKFPNKQFSFFRVGYPAVHKLRIYVCFKAK